MERMGFPMTFVQLIMRCVESVAYSFILNGTVCGRIIPGRGIRQGDPLSPLLFVMCAQGLSSLLHKGVEKGEITGIKCGRSGPIVSHLLFADDSLLFFKASTTGSHAVKQVLQKYADASGQLINFQKSAITFSPSVREMQSQEIRNLLNVPMVEGHAMYLGLPTYSMRRKTFQFGYIRDKVLKRIGSWKHKLLSAGGKEVLIKSVVQSIPTYAMSCFRLPKEVCRNIERACARFWWGHSGSNRGVSWLSWEKLCQPKSEGGMGFRDLEKFNKALLSKQVWHIQKNPDAFLSRFLKAKYFPNGDIMNAQLKSNASFIWRSILWSRPIIEEGGRWKIRDGALSDSSMMLLYLLLPRVFQ